MRVQAALTIIRDVLCLVWGFGGIALQQLNGNVNIALLTAYMAMIGVPGAFGFAELIRGRRETASIPGSLPVPQSPSSQLPSS